MGTVQGLGRSGRRAGCGGSLGFMQAGHGGPVRVGQVLPSVSRHRPGVRGGVTESGEGGGGVGQVGGDVGRFDRDTVGGRGLVGCGDLAAEPGHRGLAVDWLAPGSSIEGHLDLGDDVEHDEPGLPQGDAAGAVAQRSLRDRRRVTPLTEDEVHIRRRFVEEGPVERIDRLRLGLSEQPHRLVPVPPACGEHRAAAGEPDHPHRQRLGAFAPSEHALGRRPSAQPEEPLRGQRIQCSHRSSCRALSGERRPRRPASRSPRPGNGRHRAG